MRRQDQGGRCSNRKTLDLEGAAGKMCAPSANPLGQKSAEKRTSPSFTMGEIYVNTMASSDRSG